MATTQLAGPGSEGSQGYDKDLLQSGFDEGCNARHASADTCLAPKANMDNAEKIAAVHPDGSEVETYTWLNTPALGEESAPKETLGEWVEIINEWPSDPSRGVRKVQAKIGQGIPFQLRTVVWQLLAGSDSSPDKERYVKLLEQKSTQEGQIQRDVARALKGSELLRQVDRQDMLCRLLRAYGLYDIEMGYSPMLVHLTALLLTQLPEEDAFALLIALMEKYQLRTLFLPESDAMGLAQFYFTSLLPEVAPTAATVFQKQELEPGEYLPGWLLSFFSSILPLAVSLHVMDYVLACGGQGNAISLLLQVGLALFHDCQGDLEGLKAKEVLHYLQNELRPRHSVETRAAGYDPKAANEASAAVVMNAMQVKISGKRLRQLEKVYEAEKEALLLRNDRITQLQSEIEVALRKNDELETEGVQLQTALHDSQVKLIADQAKRATQCEQYDMLIEHLRQENQRLFLQLSPKNARRVLEEMAEEEASLLASDAGTAPVERLSSDQRRQLFERQYLLEGQLAQLPSQRVSKPAGTYEA